MMAKVAFYKGKSRIFNKLVSWWTRGPYSHTELVIGEVSEGSVCWSASYLDKGIRRKVIKLDPDHWDLIEVEMTATELGQAQEWFHQHENAAYDVLGLVGFIFRRVADDHRKFFCSEAIAASLKFNDAWRFDPNTLAAVLRGQKK
jgi:hypothetical protein